MKLSEFKKLIREEVRKTLRESLSYEPDLDALAAKWNKQAQLDQDKRYDARMAKIDAYAKTQTGKLAIETIEDLISKPYTYNDITETLNDLGLDMNQFKMAATKAGMKFDYTWAGGVEIDDKNYKNQNMNINFDEKDGWGQ